MKSQLEAPVIQNPMRLRMVGTNLMLIYWPHSDTRWEQATSDCFSHSSPWPFRFLGMISNHNKKNDQNGHNLSNGESGEISKFKRTIFRQIQIIKCKGSKGLVCLPLFERWVYFERIKFFDRASHGFCFNKEINLKRVPRTFFDRGSSMSTISLRALLRHSTLTGYLFNSFEYEGIQSRWAQFWVGRR